MHAKGRKPLEAPNLFWEGSPVLETPSTYFHREQFQTLFLYMVVVMKGSSFSELLSVCSIDMVLLNISLSG